MPTVEIDDIALLGVIRDVPEYQLPPEAWSLGENMRFVDLAAERLLGETTIFGTPSVPPYFVMYVASAAQPWWLYTSLTKAYVYDGASHTDITRAAGGDYAATGAKDWNGTLLGGVPVLNNGVDDPQFWATYASGTKLAKITNWPATTKAKVVRAFGSYLMLLSTTEGGTVFPHRLRWSSSADPGSVPVTYDVSDATHDAGEVDLPDVNSGLIMDGLPLAGQFFTYKEGSVWRTRLIGGRFIFSHDTFLETTGLLTTRCVALTGKGDQHFFVSQDDVLIHNGNSANSVVTKKFRRYLFNQIDTANYGMSFVFANPLFKEMWFCYPPQGASVPSRAMIFNLDTGAISESDVDFQCAAIGTVQTSSASTWAAVTGSWDSQLDPWSSQERRRVVLGAPATTKILELDKGSTRSGTAFTGTLQRTGLSIIGRKRNNEWIEDFETRKLCTKLWPKIRGGPVNIRVASQATVNGPVIWTTAQSFDPSSQMYIDVVISGKALGVEFSSTVDFFLDGYKFDIDVLGKF